MSNHDATGRVADQAPAPRSGIPNMPAPASPLSSTFSMAGRPSDASMQHPASPSTAGNFYPVKQSALPRSPALRQADVLPASTDQGSTYTQTGSSGARSTQTGPMSSGASSFPAHSHNLSSTLLGSEGARSTTGPVHSLAAPKSARGLPTGMHRRGPLSTASMGVGMNSSMGPQPTTGRLSDAHTAEALERREQLMLFKAQKAQAKAAQVAAKGGQHGSWGGAESRRASSAGLMSRPAPRPPMPTALPSRVTAAAITHAAHQPLPVGDESALTDGPSSPLSHSSVPRSTTSTEALLLQRGRPSQAHEAASSKVPGLPLHGRFSLGGVPTGISGSMSSRGPSNGGGLGAAAGASGSLTSRGASAGGGAGTLSARSMAVALAAGSAAAQAGHGVASDTRNEIKAVRLQELQWRYVNARMEHAIRDRKDQGEKALAACVLAISALERKTAEAHAEQARRQLLDRACQTAQSLQPVLADFAKLQAPFDGADAVLQHVTQGLLHSLTRVPLIGGAVCGRDVDEADLDALQESLTRAVAVLERIDHALQPLLPTGTARGSATSLLSSFDAAASQTNGRSTERQPKEAKQLSLPTASILHDLVTHLKSEVASLGIVRELLETLSSKQIQLTSYQAHLLQMARRQH